MFYFNKVAAAFDSASIQLIVPFAIFAADENKFTINRTQHYLVDELDHLYQSHFTRTFKLVTGLTPILVRKRGWVGSESIS